MWKLVKTVGKNVPSENERMMPPNGLVDLTRKSGIDDRIIYRIYLRIFTSAISQIHFWSNVIPSNTLFFVWVDYSQSRWSCQMSHVHQIDHKSLKKPSLNSPHTHIIFACCMTWPLFFTHQKSHQNDTIDLISSETERSHNSHEFLIQAIDDHTLYISDRHSVMEVSRIFQVFVLNNSDLNLIQREP